MRASFLFAAFAMLVFASGRISAEDRGPSFNCHKASTLVERLICGDEDLARADTHMAEIYRLRLSQLDDREKASLVADQRKWLTERAPSCSLLAAKTLNEDEKSQAVSCLLGAYQLRINEIEASTDEVPSSRVSGPIEKGPADLSSFSLNGYEFNLVTYRDPNSGLQWFNQDIKDHNDERVLVSCELLVDLPVGTAHGNHSYGAYCSAINQGRKIQVEVCDDEMIGHFEIKELDSQKRDKLALAEFVANSCFGG